MCKMCCHILPAMCVVFGQNNFFHMCSMNQSECMSFFVYNLWFGLDKQLRTQENVLANGV